LNWFLFISTRRRVYSNLGNRFRSANLHRPLHPCVPVR
jgi:hypothetical protein